ncbi:hypothetical protein C0J56_10225 [Pseudomonas fluorescens]|nr:acyltransferase family protein [Pseudomonas fluorescens]AUM69241.1 hypothetical protein C0J56_10225 [Pseudomonas fluorescens]
MSFRLDIQALRGLAVALVVLDHLDFNLFKSGFLGVDIFFVISGYLITGIIAKNLNESKFSISEFYYKRAKRLIPAVYLTILLTCLAAHMILTPMESRSLLYQVAGAVSYTTNFVLFSQAGYFDADASTKPLLHLWSLAVEEQYYLIFPLILMATPARTWLHIVATLLIVSLAACLYVNQLNPSAAFYLLPTRAWELLVGSAGYLIAQKFEIKTPYPVFIASIIVVLLVPSVDYNWAHPGLAAIIVCTSTLAIILHNYPLTNATLLSPLVKLGNISYSLYLVHWPIIVFAHATLPGEWHLSTKLVLLLTSISCAAVLYMLVEQPSRKSTVSRSRLAWLTTIGAAALLGTQFAATKLNNNSVDFANVLRPNYGLDKSCDNYLFIDNEKCRTSKTARTIIWGDSYAMHAIEGIKNHRKGGITQATYSACPPFLDTAPYNPAREDADKLSNYCVAFNDSVLSAIKNDQNIETVILAASFWQYTIPANKMLTRDRENSTRLNSTNLNQAKEDLGKTIESLQLIGKEVIIIAPPPQ